MSSMQDFDEDIYSDLVSGGDEAVEDEEEPVEDKEGAEDAPSD